MKRLPVFWHIFLATLLLLSCTLIVTAFYVAHSLKSFYYSQVEKDLKARALLIEEPVQKLFDGNRERLQAFCKKAGRRSATRITVIDTAGRVLADSNEDPEKMELHNTRPEFKKALSGIVGTSIRYSHTLHQDMLYVAVPLAGSSGSGDIRGALRVSIPLSVTRDALWTIEGKYALAGLIILIAAVLGGLFLSSRLSRPLEQMKETAEKIARGEMDEPPAVDSSGTVSEEVASLSTAMNTMARQIRERINTIDRQKNELELVFCALKEAVMVLDNNHRILRINRAAAELFAVPAKESRGWTFREVTRDTALNRTLQEVVHTRKPAEIDIACQTHAGERFLNARFAILRDRNGENAGILIVISDLTEIRRLENIRKEFVANVSHELKTPVTSIRGYAEVLLEDELESREEARRFLEIIVRQSGRLQAIIEDLLSLSRIEQDARDGNIKLENVTLGEIMESVRDICELRAGDKEINLDFSFDRNLALLANPALLVQAISNLVINAIKYSDPGSRVQISCKQGSRQEGANRTSENERREEALVISVRDYGCGIAPEHLPRIFERFYRSDKARSRKLGGTGLGLAIVKHIARVHGGSVEVESEPGKGSVFTIRIPLNREGRTVGVCGLR